MGSRARACALSVIVGLVPVGSAMADTGPSLAVDAAAARHPISPYIYGWNFVPADVGQQIGVTVDRRGGNSADTLNWQTGVENHSNDFFFENIPWCWTKDPCNAGLDPSHAYTDQINADRDAHSQTLIDLPMLGYVPKKDDAGFDQPLPCSFTNPPFLNQDAYDTPYDPTCGNGQHNDAWVTTAAQLQNAIADPPDREGAWIDDLKQRYGDAASGGVGFYELGNEPGLWNSTHHDWHPNPTSYDELRDKSLALAQQVKVHDAGAQIVGFSEWGWPNFFCSALDDTNNGCQASDVDRANHGGTPIAEWFLQQFKAYADAHGGQRLLDYIDVHYYRQDDHSSGIAATRSLWDPSYKDQSWIDDTIRMIPRMRDWVANNYPGTKTAFTEYDLALDDGDTNTHIDLDNLIQADVLGIFGREGLDLATLWPETTDLGHYQDAFRLFRNYDGGHSKFGDTAVASQSADQSKLSVYAAQRANDSALTILAINKTGSDLTSSVALAGFAPGAAAQAYQWTGTASGIRRLPDQAVDASGFRATFPAHSLTIFAVPLAGVPLQPGAPGFTPPPPGSAVTPPRCVVPKLIGLTLKKAKAKLKKAHCRLGKVTKRKSRKHKGHVIAQKPKPKTKRAAGSKVRVVLSRGR